MAQWFIGLDLCVCGAAARHDDGPTRGLGETDLLQDRLKGRIGNT